MKAGSDAHPAPAMSQGCGPTLSTVVRPYVESAHIPNTKVVRSQIPPAPAGRQGKHAWRAELHRLGQWVARLESGPNQLVIIILKESSAVTCQCFQRHQGCRAPSQRAGTPRR